MTTTPAWYVLRSDHPIARWFNTLHWPYTIWHLSYPIAGAALAKDLNGAVLSWTVLAFFLGMGIGAHCYDLAKGDPLKLGLSRRSLEVVGSVSIFGAVGIGFWQVVIGTVPSVLILAMPFGGLLAIGYGLEKFKLHGYYQFILWWAVFPLLVGYFAQGIHWNPALIPLVIWAYTTAAAQRTLSTRSRYIRRNPNTSFISPEPEDHEWVLTPIDRTLILLSIAMPLTAVTLLMV